MNSIDLSKRRDIVLGCLFLFLDVFTIFPSGFKSSVINLNRTTATDKELIPNILPVCMLDLFL
jgi:hypothetical protein